MEKSTRKKNYWGVTKWRKNLPNEVLFEGTFNQCWDWLTDKHGDKTLKNLAATGIKIERIG